jgi:protein-S-isoprenylcysteine O-methyltransferase Ste14
MLTFFQSFYTNLPIGAVAAVVIFFLFVMPEDARPAQATSREKLLQLDLIGAALMMGLIIPYILALQYAGQMHPWNSSIVIGLLVGFVAILAVFVAWEIFQKERAMIFPRLVCRDSTMLS